MKTIKELNSFDKPREKLKAKGAKALKNEELMAILLGSGIKGKDVRKLSKEITALLDSNLDNISLESLSQIHGLGIAKASQIIAAIELNKRYLIRTNKKILCANDVYEELKSYTRKTQEYFLTITLDGASHIINKRVVFIGTLNQSLVHPPRSIRRRHSQQSSRHNNSPQPPQPNPNTKPSQHKHNQAPKRGSKPSRHRTPRPHNPNQKQLLQLQRRRLPITKCFAFWVDGL